MSNKNKNIAYKVRNQVGMNGLSHHVKVNDNGLLFGIHVFL
jgi:hypothetical protein